MSRIDEILAKQKALADELEKVSNYFLHICLQRELLKLNSINALVKGRLKGFLRFSR